MACLDPGRADGTDGFIVVSLGQCATTRLAGVVAGAEPSDLSAGSGLSAASRATAGGAITDDPSGRGSGGGHDLCADAVPARTLSNQQAGGGVSGFGAAGKLQRPVATAVGPHHQAGEQSVARLAGGSSSCGRALGTAMAAEVHTAIAEEKPVDRRGSAGPLSGCSFVVDVEIGTQLWPDQRVPFACRAARLGYWGAVDPRHR